MIRITGFIVIIMGTSMMGFKYADRIKDRYKSLMYLKKVLIMLRAEIDYNESQMNEIFRELHKKTVGCFKSFFLSLYENTKGYYEKSISAYWNDAATKHLNDIGFTVEDMDKLFELGENIGYLDKNMQLKNIEYTLDYIDRETNELSLTMDKNMKMWKMFGVLAGIFITIIFV